MPSQPKDNSGESDMEPMPHESIKQTHVRFGSGEPDDSPIPPTNLNIGKGDKDANESLQLLGAGSPYKASE